MKTKTPKMSSGGSLQIATLLCVASFSSCDSDRFIPPCTPRVNLDLPPATLLTFVGQETTVPLELPSPLSCPQGNTVAKRVETQVLSPMNVPLPHTSTEPTTSESRGYATNITFTPTEPGGHYLTARFEPSIGAANRDVTVMFDRRADQPFITDLEVPEGCEPALINDSVVICFDGLSNVKVASGGWTTAIEDANGFAHSAPSLWVWNVSSVTRYEAVGVGPLVKQETLAVEFADRRLPPTGVASAGQLTLFVNDRVIQFTAANGVISANPIQVPGLTMIVGKAVQLAPGVFGTADETSGVCGVTLSPPTATCIAGSFGPFQADGQGFWGRNLETTMYFSFADGKPSSTSIADGLLVTAPMTGPQTLPFIINTFGFLTLQPKTFRVDVYQRVFPQQGVLEGAVWQITSNRLRAYRR